MSEPEFFCPHCGEALKKKDAFCRNCGSDEQTGWQAEDEKHAAQVDYGFTHLDDEAYDEFLRSEDLHAPQPQRPGSQPSSPRRNSVPILAIVIVSILAILAWWLGLGG